jgi:hypothetical protein
VTIDLPVGAAEPMFAGLDPYVKRIDRDTSDNVIAVELAD